jgi:probable DNA metabolism protein
VGDGWLLKQVANVPEIGLEGMGLARFLLEIADAEQVGRMYGHDEERAIVQLNRFAAQGTDGCGAAENRLRRRGAQRHDDPQRFALLYRMLWRLQDDRDLLQARSDSGVQRLEQMCAAVRRDAHKMKAFVRFKSILDDTGLERFAAWFEPDHYVLERVAPFFVRRFTGMLWAVVTPYRSAFWDGEELVFGGSGEKSDVPSEDALEADWKTYFSSIFNPARLKVAMMKSEMPVKYWRNLPEAELIPSLIAGANRREQDMVQGNATEPSVRHQRQMRRRSSAQASLGSMSRSSIPLPPARFPRP